MQLPAADSSDDEGLEDAEEEFVGGEDSSDEEEDTADTVATYIGNAVAPTGYKIVDECPPFATETDKQGFIGKMVLVGWDSKAATSGWYLGTVHSRGPFTKTDMKKVPTANYVVKYKNSLTNKKLHGHVACELSEHTHGAQQWWVQVVKA